ncbi:hypothetical protein [Pseudomonas fluorescens]|uniref:Uncharacterized protein n=1 Tax=Pseudomonas fluorescens TaxID=294 RepID=A0A5E7NNX9_PSEFL|nr:hypothetical protein [Pseudomonas fluorescens]VVP39061.1 hypothetical protein PS880_04747 [Pseudomonas fluorescens]
MKVMHEKSDEPAKISDCLDDEVLRFYAESFQCPRQQIKEGQRVTYVIKTDANGRRYATDIRLEDEEGQQAL